MYNTKPSTESDTFRHKILIFMFSLKSCKINKAFSYQTGEGSVMILFFCTSFGFAFFVEFLKFLELFGAFIQRLLPLDEHGIPNVLLTQAQHFLLYTGSRPKTRVSIDIHEIKAGSVSCPILQRLKLCCYRRLLNGLFKYSFDEPKPSLDECWQYDSIAHLTPT